MCRDKDLLATKSLSLRFESNLRSVPFLTFRNLQTYGTLELKSVARNSESHCNQTCICIADDFPPSGRMFEASNPRKEDGKQPTLALFSLQQVTNDKDKKSQLYPNFLWSYRGIVSAQSLHPLSPRLEQCGGGGE